MAVGRVCGVVIARPAFALVFLWLQAFSRRRAAPLSLGFVSVYGRLLSS